MNKRFLGTEYEQAAARFLEENGYRVLERNYRSRCGEIDLIAKEGETLVFAEVKYRRNNACGDPLEAVDLRKQKKICRVADWYLINRNLSSDTPCRFDVVAVTGNKLRLVRNAFSYVPAGKNASR